MKIEITFGILYSDLTGERETVVSTEAKSLTVADVAKLVLIKYPDLQSKLSNIHLTRDSILSSVFVIDQNIVRPDYLLTGDTKMKILPPIAGG